MSVSLNQASESCYLFFRYPFFASVFFYVKPPSNLANLVGVNPASRFQIHFVVNTIVARGMIDLDYHKKA